MPHRDNSSTKEEATEADAVSSRRAGRRDTDMDSPITLANSLTHEQLAIMGLTPLAMHQQVNPLPPIPFATSPQVLDHDATMTFTDMQQPRIPARTAVYHSPLGRGADRRLSLFVTTNQDDEAFEGVADSIDMDWRRYLLDVLRETSRLLDDEDEDCID